MQQSSRVNHDDYSLKTCVFISYKFRGAHTTKSAFLI